jgi:hypothetical protein
MEPPEKEKKKKKQVDENIKTNEIKTNNICHC